MKLSRFSKPAPGLMMVVMAALMVSTAAQARVDNGQTVPDLALTDANGVIHQLSDYKGKTVVLEWTNHQCPYVKKHYDTNYDGGNMQNLQKAAASDDTVWLSIISSAPGKQGAVDGARANELTASRGAAPSAVILDPSGDAGRVFSAKTTPHMYIINPEQILVYQGAIDNNRSSNPAMIAGATNYVTAGLNSVEVGARPDPGETAPYGCTIKY